MAAIRHLTRSLFTTKQSIISSLTTRSYTTTTTNSLLFKLRPLAAATCLKSPSFLSFASRGLSSRPTASSINDPNPNWSNRPPKETILLDGCDFEHWLVVMEKPQEDLTRDDIIASYIKTLASVIGSEDEARMKIYTVSTRHYYAFGALVSEELSYKLKELPNVRWVLPDSYLDVRNKDYGGEPFINGEAVPYDPKYHEEWVRNNAKANERNRRNDRPRNFDRSRNFERRRETSMNNQNPGPNSGPMQPNMQQQQPNMPPQQPNMQHQQPNYNRGPSPNNPGNYNNMGPQNPQYANAPNYQPGPNPNFNQNMGSGGYGPNTGSGQGQNPSNFSQNAGYGPPPPNQGGYAPNTRAPPGQNQGGGYAPNMGPSQGSYAPNTGGGNSYQNENVPGRDVPQPPRY